MRASWKVLGTTFITFGIVTLVVARSGTVKGDSTPTASAPSGIDEPITGVAAKTIPGSETPPKDPFAPYDIGPPGSEWTYEQASDYERAELDKFRDRTGWQQIHDGYADGVALQVQKSAVLKAEHQLGVDNLASEGVVP